MNKVLLSIILSFAFLGAGCSSLIPKRVELLQDRVQEFPETQRKDREAERRALEATQERISELKEEAVEQGLGTNVLEKLRDLEKLVDALAKNAGPPQKAPKGTAAELARKLKESTANYIEKVFKFRGDNNDNAGKKIEGTGLLQIPYFVWLLMVAGVVVFGLILFAVGWTALKAFSAANPPLAFGLSAVQMGGKVAKNILSQVLKGGEKFKYALIKSAETKQVFTAEEVKELFRQAQNEAQDEGTRDVIKHLTKKE